MLVGVAVLVANSLGLFNTICPFYAPTVVYTCVFRLCWWLRDCRHRFVAPRAVSATANIINCNLLNVCPTTITCPAGDVRGRVLCTLLQPAVLRHVVPLPVSLLRCLQDCVVNCDSVNGCPTRRIVCPDGYLCGITCGPNNSCPGSEFVQGEGRCCCVAVLDLQEQCARVVCRMRAGTAAGSVMVVDCLATDACLKTRSVAS